MPDKDVRVICEKGDMEAFFASIPITGKTIKDIKCIGMPEELKRSGTWKGKQTAQSGKRSRIMEKHRKQR